MVDIDPRNTVTFDSCTNCGACISACDTLHQKKGEKGLLSFKFGKRRTKEKLAQRSVASLKQRVRWVLPVWLLGTGMFIWGLISYDPYHLVVYKSDKHQGDQINEYRIHLANKLYEDGEIKLTVAGLNADEYQLSETIVKLPVAGRYDAFVTIKNNLSPGLHSFIVKAESESGWADQVRIQHFVKNG